MEERWRSLVRNFYPLEEVVEPEIVIAAVRALAKPIESVVSGAFALELTQEDRDRIVALALEVVELRAECGRLKEENKREESTNRKTASGRTLHGGFGGSLRDLSCSQISLWYQTA